MTADHHRSVEPLGRSRLDMLECHTVEHEHICPRCGCEWSHTAKRCKDRTMVLCQACAYKPMPRAYRPVPQTEDSDDAAVGSQD
jgi:hypothetical protein